MKTETAVKTRTAAGDSRGFTLVEMMVTIGVLAVMAGAALPQFMDLTPRMRLKSVARAVVTDMQWARIHAIRSKTTWAIHFDTANGRYRILSDDGGDGDWTNGNETVAKTVLLPGASGIAFGNDHGSRPNEPDPGETDGVSFTNDLVLFNSDGTGETGTVYLKCHRGETMAVGSNSIAGGIRTWRNFGGGWEV